MAAAMTGHGATVLLQSVDRGTAAGVLLPVHWIRNRAPDAIVAVFPSDHLVLEEAAFMDQVTQAADLRERASGAHRAPRGPGHGPGDGVRMDRAGALAGHAGAAPIRAVRRFIEKPSPEVAQSCLDAGASWNTFVFVGKARTLVEAGRRRSRISTRDWSAWSRPPGAARAPMRSGGRAWRFRAPTSPVTSCRSCPGCSRSRTLTGVTWCDWGSPRRVIESLEQLGLRPHWLDRLTEPIGSAAAR
jgi:hypothetical protein